MEYALADFAAFRQYPSQAATPTRCLPRPQQLKSCIVTLCLPSCDFEGLGGKRIFCLPTLQVYSTSVSRNCLALLRAKINLNFNQFLGFRNLRCLDDFSNSQIYFFEVVKGDFFCRFISSAMQFTLKR